MSRHTFASSFLGLFHSAEPPLSHPSIRTLCDDIARCRWCSRFSRCCYLIIDLSSTFRWSWPQELAVGTPLISLGPALVGNSLCRGRERTMREQRSKSEIR